MYAFAFTTTPIQTPYDTQFSAILSNVKELANQTVNKLYGHSVLGHRLIIYKQPDGEGVRELLHRLPDGEGDTALLKLIQQLLSLRKSRV